MKFSRKFIWGFLILLALLVALYVYWQNNKYRIVAETVSNVVIRESDSLYRISYDSLHFDEIAGNATIRNIRIVADTQRIRQLTSEHVPDIVMNATIKKLTVTGIKTARALTGKEMTGDSVIIDNADILMYSLHSMRKATVIESEASALYKQILGKLDKIKVNFVFVNNVNIQSVDFFSGHKNFDGFNGKLILDDLLIDSVHHMDTSRILFCKQAAFTLDSFITYNNNRQELGLKDINFVGKRKTLLINHVTVDRFEGDTSKGFRLVDASALTFSGINSNEIIKNKNLYVDTILCANIFVYQMPVDDLKRRHPRKETNDSAGFRNVYSVGLEHLNFPKVTFVPFAKSRLKVGNISIKVNGVLADQVSQIQAAPMDYSHEVAMMIDNASFASSDGLYNFDFQKIGINSLKKQLSVAAVNVIPNGSEQQFMARLKFQDDRYDIRLKNISLNDIHMNTLFSKKLIASQLNIGNMNARIYRDLNLPLEKVEKNSNYPSQLLQKLNLPVNITRATVSSAFIQYREREVLTDSTGVIGFYNTRLNISNISNMDDSNAKNNQITIAFSTKVLGTIPLEGNFKFVLRDSAGTFYSIGKVAGFNGLELNKVSVPMALIRITSGTIHSIDFHLTGNNTGAKGDFVMKYNDLKVHVLKRDDESGEIKKRGLATFAANTLVQNNNPGSKGLRTAHPSFKRDMHKSFFNLVWKTIFKGMKETVGLP
jgi:hypothetical protein